MDEGRGHHEAVKGRREEGKREMSAGPVTDSLLLKLGRWDPFRNSVSSDLTDQAAS